MWKISLSQRCRINGSLLGHTRPQRQTNGAPGGAGPSVMPGGDRDDAVWRYQRPLDATTKKVQGGLGNCHWQPRIRGTDYVLHPIDMLQGGGGMGMDYVER